MKAVKGNKEYAISPEQKDQYAKLGFDIYDKGKKLLDAVGKSVSVEEYQAVADKNAELEKRLAELEKGAKQ